MNGNDAFNEIKKLVDEEVKLTRSDSIRYDRLMMILMEVFKVNGGNQ